MDEDTTVDQREPHQRSPPEPCSFETLDALGVLHWEGLDADNHETAEDMNTLRVERGYSYMDVIEISPEKLPNYEERIKIFFTEHIHDDEEIRYCLAGSGYFDVRDLQDRWIRIAVEKGDMIVLPEGIYHRFTLDSNNYIKACRLFKGDPVWTPLNRPQEESPSRAKYLEQFGGAAASAVTA